MFGEITDVRVVSPIIQNLLTVVSFLIGTASFILGLHIQNVAKLSEQINKYMKVLILALVFPAIFIIFYGIIITGINLEAEDIHYLIILTVLFVPVFIILLLETKLNGMINNY